MMTLGLYDPQVLAYARQTGMTDLEARAIMNDQNKRYEDYRQLRDMLAMPFMSADPAPRCPSFFERLSEFLPIGINIELTPKSNSLSSTPASKPLYRRKAK